MRGWEGVTTHQEGRETAERVAEAKRRCQLGFRGAACGWRPEYVGNPHGCDKSLEDCKAHGNERRFGGFPGTVPSKAPCAHSWGSDGAGGPAFCMKCGDPKASALTPLTDWPVREFAMGPVKEVRDVRVNGVPVEDYGEKIARMAREQKCGVLDVRFPSYVPPLGPPPPPKRGVIIEFDARTHRHLDAAGAVRAVEKLGLPGIHEIHAEGFVDFETDRVLVKLRSFDPKADWLPIVKEACEYPHWTPEFLAEVLARVYPVKGRRR